MNDEIRSLIESLRRGDYEDPEEKIGLLVAALREFHVDSGFLLSLLRAPQAVLRLAGVQAASGHADPEIHAAVHALVEDREDRVRVKVAETFGTWPEAVAKESLERLMGDLDPEVRQAAVKASSGKATLLPFQRSLIASDSNWAVRLSAARALNEHPTPEIIPDLLQALANDEDEDVRRRCAEFLEKRLQRRENGTKDHLLGDATLLNRCQRQLKTLGGRVPTLTQWIEEQTQEAIDPDVLAAFGTDLTALAHTHSLPRACAFEEPVKALLALFQPGSRRSLVLVGESGVGKSALVNELTYALARPENGNWRVLRMSPTDFMSGTRYLGEWETRVKDLIQAIRKPKRILLFVPNLNDLYSMGRWSKSDANVATAMAPHLEDGSIVILGESTPEEFEKGIGSNPSLQRLFDKVLVQEASIETTQRILTLIAQEANAILEPTMIDRLVEISGFYLSHLKRPGNAATLLRAALDGRRESGQLIGFRDILEVLSKSTGVPIQLLDDSVALQPATLQSFFEERIIGQPEAVESVVDLVTLIKAGLTDPSKAFGVLLFVGPTGVGKTEIARALAEYIFGDAKRLLRFDMSEYASPEGFRRLIGNPGENGALTDAVRQQPFSVVLLDEIEKSHLNVFDVCLQLFDAGRLTDGRGRLVDFRRCILIMTSNIGAETPNRPLGFVADAATGAPEMDPDRTWRELSRFFRPEFLNRIDRIVSFRALSIEVAERIARREIDLVLQRSGITRRHLAINVDPAALSLLVREGYSPHFGARPLKRTVERRLLLPLARSLTSGASQAHSVLSLRVRENQIEVVVVSKPAVSKGPAIASTNSPLIQRIAELGSELQALRQQVRPLLERKSELVGETQREGFYQDAVKRNAVFDGIRRLDQFFQLLEAVERNLEAVEHRIRTGGFVPRDVPTLTDRLNSLEADLSHIRSVATASDAVDLGDAFFQLQFVDRSGGSIKGIEQLSRMYLAWAKRKRLSALFLGEYYLEKADRVLIEVTGLGAYGLMKRETGLHQLDHRHKRPARRGEREKILEDREVIRVEVLPIADEVDQKFESETSAKWKELKPARDRLVEKARWWGSLFHKPSLQSLEIWMAGTRESAHEDALRFLRSYVRFLPLITAAPFEITRHYCLGIGSKIKDARSGKTATNIAAVLKGNLDLLR